MTVYRVARGDPGLAVEAVVVEGFIDAEGKIVPRLSSGRSYVKRQRPVIC